MVAPAPVKATKEEVRAMLPRSAKRLKTLKDNVDAAEHEIAALNTELAKYERVLADPLIFSQDPQKAKNVSKSAPDALKKLADIETRWLKMQEDTKPRWRVEPSGRNSDKARPSASPRLRVNQRAFKRRTKLLALKFSARVPQWRGRRRMRWL